MEILIKPPADVTDARVFELMSEGQNAPTFKIVALINEQSEKIRRLDEVTRQIDTPFVSSYLTA